ncbi:metal tolerance protein C2 [Malania oleifera]|uniref:metal tolerance protein C2 n=1 Tax=Malania oleifera TaxID=397392 RepID=UPI0025AE395C|nr:metal tolerance protein C2 [Malania oleifera]XP_057983059.1 metal tolerance protein C2 [Malania oleifera]XP_057983060.1 metal tolerance protein C2 [Malania oleifera]
MESANVSDRMDLRDPLLEAASVTHRTAKADSHKTRNKEFGYGFEAGDRRLVFSRQSSFHQAHEPRTPVSIISNDKAKPWLSRSVSSIDIPPAIDPLEEYEKFTGEEKSSTEKISAFWLVTSAFRLIRSGNRPMKRLFILISLNVAYSTAELFIGLLSGRVGLVSDAFHLTFGCGLLTFSLFAMAASRRKPDCAYTYGYKRLEVLSAFTNALFLLFMSFSLAVEALHAFIQDESEHKHYLIVSAVTNLLVNLIGVWFFRNYARINLVYQKAEDMNYHSVCLHVLADSIRSAGLILASWFLSLGVKNAEVLCLGLVSVAVFMLVMPLFRVTGSILLQMAPPGIPSSALSKCWRQIAAHEDVSEVSQARFWELVPGYVVGSLSLQVKKGIDDRLILQYVHGLYHDLGVQDLTVQTDYA